MLSSNSTPNSVSSLSCFDRLLMLTRNLVVSHGPQSRSGDFPTERRVVITFLRMAVDTYGRYYKTRTMVHPGTFRNIPEHQIMIVMTKICEIIISKIKLNKDKLVSVKNRYVKKKKTEKKR